MASHSDVFVIAVPAAFFPSLLVLYVDDLVLHSYCPVCMGLQQVLCVGLHQVLCCGLRMLHTA